MLSEDILYLSVRELGDHIRSRNLSPVELAESYLKRSESIGSKLNAYATVTRELAVREARQAEHEIRAGKYRGPLHGIPYAAKDLLAGLKDFETEQKKVLQESMDMKLKSAEDFSDDDKKKIYEGNARRMLRLRFK